MVGTRKKGAGIFLGLTTVDILNYVSRYPGSNEKVRARDQLIHAGGPAANAAVAFRALGNKARLITALGEQSLADLARDDLRIHCVEVMDLTADPQLLPVLSSIVVEESTGNRSVVYSDTTGRKLIAKSVAMDIPEETTILMLDGYYLPQAVQFAAQAKRRGKPVVLDGGSWKAGLETLLPFVDCAICSANFYPPGTSTRSEVLQYLKNRDVASIAISGGAAPVYGWQEGSEKEIEIAEVEVVDTLGAGDILHGAFCHYIQTRDFFSSLRMATEVASESCRFKGTRAWITEFKEKGKK